MQASPRSLRFTSRVDGEALPNQLQTELQIPRAPCVRDLAKCRSVDDIAGNSEIRNVNGIEGFKTKLCNNIFCNLKAFKGGEIYIVGTGTCKNIPSSIPKKGSFGANACVLK